MNETVPVISVIITTYNQENVIARAIESVISQRCSYPMEIIIGEDCSSDSTAEVCRRYAAEYPRLIKLMANPVNKGIIDNYFDCILAAKGRYIADCAGDDFWTDPLKLQKEADILERYPAVTLVHADWNYYHDNDGSISRPLPKSGKFKYRAPITPGRDIMASFLGGDESPVPIIHLCSAMFRKEVFVKAYNDDPAIFRTKEYNCEDVQLTMAMLEAGDIAFIPDKVLNYSVGHRSISSDEDSAKTFDFYYGVMKLKFLLEKKHGVPREKTADAFRTDIHYMLTQAFHCRSKSRRDDLISLARANGIPLTVKGRILVALTSNRLTWRIAESLCKMR